MIYRETILNLGGEEINVFMHNGFFRFSREISPLHSHRVTEVQIMVEGSASLEVAGEMIRIEKNEMLVIPANVYHERKEFSKDAKMIAFQLSKKTRNMEVLSLPEGIAQLLSAEIEKFNCGKTNSKISIYLSLLCAEIQRTANDTLIPIRDRAYMIHEFFSKNYNRDVTLSDLAQMLELSEKQTERLVMAYTGNTFRKEISRCRIEAAKLLMNSGKYSLTEIAEMVGYRSYSGFWKAFNGAEYNKK